MKKLFVCFVFFLVFGSIRVFSVFLVALCTAAAHRSSHLIRTLAVALGELAGDLLGADGEAISVSESDSSLRALGELYHSEASNGAIVGTALVHVLGNMDITNSAVCREDGLELLYRDVSW